MSLALSLLLIYFPLNPLWHSFTTVSLPLSLSGSSIRVTLSHLSAMRWEMCVYATVSSIWSMLSVLHIPVQISYGYAFLFLSHPLSPQCRPSKGRRRGHCWCVDKYGQTIPRYEGKEKINCYNMETKWRGERERQSGGNRETKRDISPEELHEYRFKSAVPKLNSHLYAEAWTHMTSNSLYTSGEWGEWEEETVRLESVMSSVLDCIPRGKCEHNIIKSTSKFQ